VGFNPGYNLGNFPPPTIMGTKTVLLIDDEISGLTVRRGVLERLGYRVLVAESAYQGFALFTRRNVDVAVLDYYLPDTDGGMLAVAMRLVKPRVPLILFSTSVSIPAEALDAVDAFVAKGEDPRSLVDAIRGILNSAEPDAETA
jgi:CheY-like chemotaxis protein